MKFDISDYEVAPHPETRSWVYVWEPLNVDVPQSAHPYCCYANMVIFYEDDLHRVELGSTRHTITHSFKGETLLLYGSRHFFLMSGKVVWHNNAWYMRWTAHKSSAFLEEENDERKGYWCQGECVFIRANAPTTACELYRSKLSKGSIGVTSHMPDSIRNRTVNEKLQRLMKVLDLAEQALQETCDIRGEHQQIVGAALEEISEFRKTKFGAGAHENV